ncbi:hypothetical protein Ddye_001567 [Dipteronia dyeriana]|uniref:DUF309 domain-containing protein n=1 Tax=Dipteronia dyeriana TaxID=168575 RepID=A0AAD9XQ45_9ROSI|nr:hypothetical protein Ddye_001567 [Dipteronia dyeriana]
MALPPKITNLSSPTTTTPSASPTFIQILSPNNFCLTFLNKPPPSSSYSAKTHNHNLKSFRASYRFSATEDDAESCSFDEAVAHFNERAYYKCHDCLEALWNDSEEPTRTLIHGILQCAVGFYHLFNQNHKGAMMELGEGLWKLRKMNFLSGPFHQFEKDISATLDFIYQTQIELAACGDDVCVAMDQSERSYQLLGDYAAGEYVYYLESENHDDDDDITYIVFNPQRVYASEFSSISRPRVKLPILNATQQHLINTTQL